MGDFPAQGAFDRGINPDGGGSTGSRMADPADMVGSFNTRLTPAQETAFQQWASRSGRANDTYDYDLRGAWLKAAKQAGNGHLPDTWKKPNHPTFSAESMYSTPDNQGGQWVEGADGKWLFMASPANLRYRDENALQGYFRDREPDSRLIPPANLNALRPVR